MHGDDGNELGQAISRFRAISSLTNWSQGRTLVGEANVTRRFYLASVERAAVCVRRSMTQEWITCPSGSSLANPKGGKAP
jgi:hypothetical protein